MERGTAPWGSPGDLRRPPTDSGEKEERGGSGFGQGHIHCDQCDIVHGGNRRGLYGDTLTMFLYI